MTEYVSACNLWENMKSEREYLSLVLYNHYIYRDETAITSAECPKLQIICYFKADYIAMMSI
jgi:hypothetical protein